METQKRAGRRIIIALVLFLVMGIVLSGVYVIYVAGEKAEQRLTRLLCKTDYQELLAACRQLSALATTGALPPGDYWVRLNRQPQLAEVPVPIVKVDPIYVHIDDEGYVILEMGGIPSYGVVAYPRGSKVEDSWFTGSIQLIPGLYYYDEDYHDQFPDYMQHINKLIQEGRMRNRVGSDTIDEIGGADGG